MKKIFTIIVILFMTSNCYSQVETMSFDAPKDSGYRLTLYGYFNKPGTVAPSITLFTFKGENKRYPTSINYYDQYKFSGRTGDKTFEIEHYNGGTVTAPIKETLKLYFEENSNFSLKFTRISTNCTASDEILLKMIKMNGNELEYLIILPDCLKSNLTKR